MANFILIGLCILAGYLLQRFTNLSPDAYKGVNAWIINLALPAVSFKYLPHIQWTTALLLPALMPLLIWFCAWLYIKAYANRNNLDKATTAGLRLTTGLCNTSFVGFPLITAYFGAQHLSIGVICDQVTFMLLSTAGILVALRASGNETPSLKTITKKVIAFPPFIACIAALVLPVLVDLSPLDEVFEKLASTIGPLALFSIGLQIKFDGWQKELKPLGFALLFKLIVAPVLILSVVLLTELKNNIAQISIFESAMPPFLTSGIIATQYQLNPKLSNLIIGIGILLSFITTAIWHWVIVTFIHV
ncbi:MAG: AEC family transporter [Agriterribacter sp.]